MKSSKAAWLKNEEKLAAIREAKHAAQEEARKPKAKGKK